MQKARRILTGGWRGNALSHFTRGWFGAAPALATGLVHVTFGSSQPGVGFSSKQPGVDFGSSQPGVTWEGES